MKLRRTLLRAGAASIAVASLFAASPIIAQSAEARLAAYRERVERLEDVGIGKGFGVGEVFLLLKGGETIGCRNQNGE